MPTYDYRCRICKQEQEIQHKMNDNDIFECVFCRGIMDKMVSLPSTPHFKGTGFYETDYKGKP